MEKSHGNDGSQGKYLKNGGVTRWTVSGDYDQKISGTCIHKRRIQPRHENVVKVTVKFIEGEGKALQEKTMMDPGQVGQKGQSFFKRLL